MTQNSIPDWLMKNDEYEPRIEKVSFIDKSTKSVIGTISRLKQNGAIDKAKGANTSFRLFGIFVITVLMGFSKNFSFSILMMTLAIIRIAMLSGEKIKALLKVLSPVLIISLLILLPSVFMGNPKTPITILSKIFVCVSIVMGFNLSTGFNEITKSLKTFHIPDVLIFTIDLAIKYIYILSNTCNEMLKALKIRSIGKNNDKKSAASGILGTVLIKAKSASEETSKAMECRGFNGCYPKAKEKYKITKYDAIYSIIFVGIIGAFIYFEVIL